MRSMALVLIALCTATSAGAQNRDNLQQSVAAHRQECRKDKTSRGARQACIRVIIDLGKSSEADADTWCKMNNNECRSLEQ